MKNNRTVALVSSPFQTLCALKAIDEFGCGVTEFYTVEDKQNTPKIRLLLSDYGYNLSVIQQSSNIFHWYLDNKKRDRYETLIVGDIFSFPLLILTSIFAKRKSQVIYVDDGNSTLSINVGLMPDYIYDFKWKLVLFICKLKQISRRLFTMYPIEKYDDMPIVRYSPLTLINNNTQIEPKGVFIIGTNTSALNADTKKYKTTLRQIYNYYYEREPVYYCPHRRDLNVYDDFCSNNGLIVYDTKVSVEYDFIKSKQYPKVIIGFGSTALYTLKKMFPQSEIYNINMERNNYRIAKIYDYIAGLYENEGITNCKMDKWK